jgi:uncharacterized repeat protein (TIGR03809 family)
MTDRVDAARGRDIVARWCAFAEQRLEYLTELFETGRWRRFHTERAFLENIQEAKTAVEIWRGLATREASRNNASVDLSWLGRTGAGLPRENTRRVAMAAEAGRVASFEAPSAPDSDSPVMAEPGIDDVSELVPDLDAIEERYPLLRNAL